MTEQPLALWLAELDERRSAILAVVPQFAPELRRLHEHELASNQWHEKTEWVQQTVQPHELGMHRADVLRQRIERLHAINAQLLEALEGFMSSAEAIGWQYAKARAAIAAAKEVA